SPSQHRPRSRGFRQPPRPLAVVPPPAQIPPTRAAFAFPLPGVYAGTRAHLRLIFPPVENKYAGGNPVCVRPTPKWQKGIGEFFMLSPKDSDKENRMPEEAGSSGLGKAKRKACPLPPDHTEDEKE
uniref:PCNA-associated factor n=1 Tax=Suricata suricatta TaxID=37032 RepID=A0A673UM33_SURSU